MASMLPFSPPPLLKPMVSPLPSSIGNTQFEKKQRHSVISQVATEPRVTVPVRRTETARPDGTGTGQISAWTSVRQERWAGELAVEGKIPLWLVRYIPVLYLIHNNFLSGVLYMIISSSSCIYYNHICMIFI